MRGQTVLTGDMLQTTFGLGAACERRGRPGLYLLHGSPGASCSAARAWQQTGPARLLPGWRGSWRQPTYTPFPVPMCCELSCKKHEDIPKKSQ